tara:strand:- start:4302 stop:7697 length:3396 start_codon:yes stop_codon:yes gene_type:complete
MAGLTFQNKTKGSQFFDNYGLDFLSPTNDQVVDAALTRGWRWTGTSAINRMAEIERIRRYTDESREGRQSIRENLSLRGTRVASKVPFIDLDDYPDFQESDVENIPAEQANLKYGIKGHLQFHEPVSNLEAHVLHQRKQEELRYNYVLERAKGGQWWAGFGLEMVTGILDPVGLPLMLIPPLGASKVLAKLGWQGSRYGRRAVTGALGGLYGSTALEPLVYAAHKQEQADYSGFNSLTNIAFGTIGGSILHLGGGAVADGVRYVRKKRHVASVDTAVKQMAAGRSVEVEPIARGSEEPDAGVTYLDDLSEDIPAVRPDEAVREAEIVRRVISELTPQQRAQLPGGATTEDFMQAFATYLETKAKTIDHAAVETEAPLLLVYQKARRGAEITPEERVKAEEQVQEITQPKEPTQEPVQEAALSEDQQKVINKAREMMEGPRAIERNDTEETAKNIGQNMGPEFEQLFRKEVKKISDQNIANYQAGQDATVDFGKKEAVEAVESLGTAARQLDEPVGTPEPDINYNEGDFVNTDPAQIELPEALLIDNLEQIGEQAGTQKGGVYRDKATNIEYYVKFPSNADQAVSEFVAAQLYRLFNVPFPTTTLVANKEGKFIGVASQMIPGAKMITPDQFRALPDDIRQDFLKHGIIDMYLGNRDVVGNAPNFNLVLHPSGKVMRIDPGGALLYRAQGGYKQLDSEFSEISSMVDPTIAPTTHEVFETFNPAYASESESFNLSQFYRGNEDAAIELFSTPQQMVDDIVDSAGIRNAEIIKRQLYQRRVVLTTNDAFVDAAQKATEKRGVPIQAFSASKAEKILQDDLVDNPKSFTKKEKDAIFAYTEHSDDFNQYMRLGPKKGALAFSEFYVAKFDQMKVHLKKAMKKLQTPQKIVVYRGGTPYYAFDKIKGVKGVKMSDETDLKNARKLVGGTISWRQFASTSLHVNKAKKFNGKEDVLLRIDLPKGVNFMYAQQKPFWSYGIGEYEILLPPDQEYVVKHAGRFLGQMVITLEALPPGKKVPPTVTKETAIKIAQKHRESPDNGVADSQDALPYEDVATVQETLKQHTPEKDLTALQDDIAEMETQLNAELENLDETVAAGIRKELENVAAEGDQAVAFAQELHDAAKAGAVCLRASAA